MLKDLAVVICTRNRSADALKALNSIKSQSPAPLAVIVVDSSDDSKLQDDLEAFSSSFNVYYLRSAAGLPHQRNVGLDFAAANSFTHLVFMDDDVRLLSPGTLSALRLRLDDPKVALVAPFDQALKPLRKSTIRRLLHLGDARSMGKILRTGVCVPASHVYQKSETVEVEWVPGLCFGVRVDDALAVGFPEYIKFFGEDVEFQANLARLGKFEMLASALVSHESSSQNRAGDSEARYWDLLFKFRLATLYAHVTKFWVLVYALASSVDYAFKAATLREYIAFERSTVRALRAGFGGSGYGSNWSA